MQLRHHRTRHTATALTSGSHSTTAVFADRAVHNGYQALALSLFRRGAFLLGRTFFRYVRAVRSFVGLNVLESTFRVPHCIEFGARDTAMRGAFASHVSSLFLAVHSMPRAWEN